jgi:hypothetical protein
MKSFIRAAEIWLPAQDAAALEFGAGLFGDASAFAETSRAMRFHKTQGLPGQAWAVGHPVLLGTLDGADFKRAQAAKDAGLTCAIALPFYAGGQLKAVVTLFCGDGQASKGAMELWRNDPRITSDMSLKDGYYGGLPPEFERLSRDAYLPRGKGLPGLAWQTEEIVISGQVSESTRFLRGEAATDAGICRALALPCPSATNASYVLMLMSGDKTPIARRMERWVFDRAAEQITLAGGYDETSGDLAGGQQTLKLPELDHMVAAVLGQGVPALSETAPALAGPMGAAAMQAGAQACLCLPVLAEDRVAEMVAIYL